MRRIGGAISAAALMVGLLPPTASAQTGSFALEVASGRFTDAAGEPNDLFEQGTPVHATLTLRNTGEVAATGVTGTLTFERGRVITGTASWPDIAPGEQAANAEPFVFSWTEGRGAPDPDCFLIVDEHEVDADQIVNDPEANDAILNDPSTDPSDQIRPIPPGSIMFHITADQGTLDHVIPFVAVCAAITTPGSRRERLPTTGAQPVVGLLGFVFIVAGGFLRRRARIA
jgi:hypothetical protein